MEISDGTPLERIEKGSIDCDHSISKNLMRFDGIKNA